MKKWLRSLLVFMVIFVLAACGSEQNTTRETPANEPAAAVEEEPDISPEETQTEAEEEDTRTDTAQEAVEPDTAESEEKAELPEDGVYTSKEEVAWYLNVYGHLPYNFITKKEAESLGWSGGSLEPYAPGMCIGGNRFGNYEGILPEKEGRTYTECDIDTLGADKRGAKRIVFSNDGLIYYTEDHYESFELLYGEE